MGLRVPESQRAVAAPSGALPAPTASTGTALRQVGRALTEVTTQIFDARNTAETDALAFRIANDLATEVDRINREVDPADAMSAFEQSIEQFESVIQDQSSNDIVASGVLADFHGRVLRAGVTVRSAVHKRNVEIAKAHVLDSETQLLERYSLTPTPIMREGVIADHSAMLERHVKSGLISIDDAREREKKFLETAEEQRAITMLISGQNDELAIRLAEGDFAALPSKRLLALKVANGRMLSAARARTKNAANARELEFESDFLRDTFTLPIEGMSVLEATIPLRVQAGQFSPAAARRAAADIQARIKREEAGGPDAAKRVLARTRADALVAADALTTQSLSGLAPSLSISDTARFASIARTERQQLESRALSQLGAVINIIVDQNNNLIVPDNIPDAVLMAYGEVYENMQRHFDAEVQRIGQGTLAPDAREHPFDVLDRFQQELRKASSIVMNDTASVDIAELEAELKRLETQQLEIQPGFFGLSAEQRQVSFNNAQRMREIEKQIEFARASAAVERTRPGATNAP